MDVIPVIDLKGGCVVHARRGERDRYRPIATPLAATSAPLDVARGLLALYRFPILYVADLDAIERSGDNCDAIRRLEAELPDVTLWTDCGIADVDTADDWLASGRGDLVIASEAQVDAGLMRRFRDDPRTILSLDFRERPLGPPALMQEPGAWPHRVIVMTLARVGSGEGPDLERLRTVRDLAGSRQVYAAGGVRDRADLVILQGAGIAGALVASCLHAGRLSGADIAALHAAE